MFVQLFAPRGEGLKRHTDLNAFFRGDVGNSNLPHRRSFLASEIEIINQTGLMVAYKLLKEAYGDESDGKWDNMPNAVRLTWQHIERQKNLSRSDFRLTSLLNLALLESVLNSSWNGGVTERELSFFAPSSPAIGDALDAARKVVASDTPPTTMDDFEQMVLETLSADTSHDSSSFTPRFVLSEQDLGEFQALYRRRVELQIPSNPRVQQQVDAKWGAAKASKKKPILPGQQDLASMFVAGGSSQPETSRTDGSIMELPEKKFGVRFSSDSLAILRRAAGSAEALSQALASYFSIVRRSTNAQADVVKALLNARESGVVLVLINAVPAAGKTEVNVLASTTAILLQPEKPRQVYGSAPMKTSAREILERYSSHGLGFLEAYLKEQKPSALFDWSHEGEGMSTLLKSQNNHSFAMYVMRNRFQLPMCDEDAPPGRRPYTMVRDDGKRDTGNGETLDDRLSAAAREQRLSEITPKTRKSVAKDPAVARFLRNFEFFSPEDAQTQRSLRACVSEADLNEWCASYAIDPTTELDAHSIGRLLLYLVTEIRVGSKRTLRMDDDSPSPITEHVMFHALAFQCNTIYATWSERLGCPGATNIFSQFADCAAHCKAVCKFATSFFEKDAIAAAIGPLPERLDVAVAARRLRSEALLEVANNAQYPSGVTKGGGTFPFDPAYEEHVTEEAVDGLMIDRDMMITLIKSFDAELLRNYTITWEMALFAVYSQPVDSNSSGIPGSTFKILDEAEAVQKKMLMLAEAQVHWELKKAKEKRAVVVVSGQCEQGVLGFLGAYGDFVQFFANSGINPANILNLTLDENLASSNPIVEIYNTIVAHCDTYDPIFARPGPSPPVGPLPLIHHRFIDDNISWHAKKKPPNTYEWVRMGLLKDHQVWDHAVEEGIRFCRDELSAGRPIPTEIALLLRENVPYAELQSLWRHKFAECGSNYSVPTLVIFTHHRSLGQRFDFVVVAGLFATSFVCQQNECEVHDALKLLLVACSRPRRGLTILLHHTARRSKTGGLVKSPRYEGFMIDQLFPDVSTRLYRVAHAAIPLLLSHPPEPSGSAEAEFEKAKRKRKEASGEGSSTDNPRSSAQKKA